MPKMQFDCSTTWKFCWQYVTQTPTAKEKMPLLGFENWYRQWKKCRQQGHLRRRHGSCDERLLEKSKKTGQITWANILQPADAAQPTIRQPTESQQPSIVMNQNSSSEGPIRIKCSIAQIVWKDFVLDIIIPSYAMQTPSFYSCSRTITSASITPIRFPGFRWSMNAWSIFVCSLKFVNKFD